MGACSSVAPIVIGAVACAAIIALSVLALSVAQAGLLCLVVAGVGTWLGGQSGLPMATAKERYLQIARELLDKGDDPSVFVARAMEMDVQDPALIGALSLLHQAAWLGDQALTAAILRSEAYNLNLNTPCRAYQNFTPLHIAAQKGHVDIVALLLGQPGIDIDARARTTRATALHLAIDYRHVQIARMLVERGADVSLTAYCDGPIYDAISAEQLAQRMGITL